MFCGRNDVLAKGMDYDKMCSFMSLADQVFYEENTFNDTVCSHAACVRVLRRESINDTSSRPRQWNAQEGTGETRSDLTKHSPRSHREVRFRHLRRVMYRYVLRAE